MQDLKFEIYKPKKFALLSKILREITLKLKQKLSNKTYNWFRKTKFGMQINEFFPFDNFNDL